MGVFNRSNQKLDWDFAEELLRHRGPDDRGTYVDPKGRMEILFRRLSIIDLSGGHQPVFNADRTIAVVLNGEIYNYKELRAELKAQGAQLRTEGDTEVIAFLFDREGPTMVNRLEGMFSILLWDEKTGILHIFRDRFGIKPLYLSESPDHVVIASEIKPLLRLPFVGVDLSKIGLSQYLSFGYTIAPDTIFEKVKKIPPATHLEIGPKGMFSRTYWDIDASKKNNYAKEDILNELDRSIELHLRSDVKVGAFLSGGVDSSLMVARAAIQGAELSTYTLKFKDAPIDESEIAAEVSKRYGTKHRTIEVTGDDFLQSLPALTWAFDEPIADSGTFPNYLISKAAAEDGCKVVLSGTGGDELFAGYVYHTRTDLELKLKLAAPLLRIAGRMFSGELGRKLYRTGSFDSDPEAHYAGHTSVFPHPENLRFDLMFSKTKSDWLGRFKGDPSTARLYADLHTYVPDNLMFLLDRTTMATSLEGRVPYLHRPLVEAALSLSSQVRTPSGKRKGFLKNLARPYLPDSVYNQPKMGFSSPMNQWLRGDLGKKLWSVLLSESFKNRFGWNEYAVTEASLRSLNFHQLWTLFQLELFCRMHIDRKPLPSSLPSLKELTDSD